MNAQVPNPFSDAESTAVSVCLSDNPYASPVDTRPGWWDKTLLRRFLKACAWIILLLIVVDLAAALQLFYFHPAVWVMNRPFLDQVWEFLTGWN